MAWENIQERLTKVFNVEIPFPSGSIWLPDTYLTVDDWLTSVAVTDEELKELNMSRIQFLNNRWPTEKLMDLEWDDKPFTRRSVWAMHVGRRAYVLFYDGAEYQLIASLEPKNEPTLYRAVLGELLRNRNFVPEHPATIKNRRPDLVSSAVIESWLSDRGSGEIVEWMDKETLAGHVPRERSYIWKLLIGWVGAWIDLPVSGFWWHEEVRPEKQEMTVVPVNKASADRQELRQIL
jgi:hypothetical protein